MSDEMEEDEEIFPQAGVPTQTIFKDKGNGQHGVPEASIKQTIFALLTANGRNINLQVIEIFNTFVNL